MKPCSLLVVIAAIVTFVACGKREDKQLDMDDDIMSSSYKALGDSMSYGLACDGCSDSVLVLLPDSGGDPVNYDIVEATRNHKVFGRPSIGDKMAVIVDSLDPKKLTFVVDLEEVKGTWYYLEMPQLRHHFVPHDSNDVKQMAPKERDEHFDSIMKTIMVPREYVYTLKSDYTMVTTGGPPRNSSLEGNTPIVYPPITRYTEWHVHNGKLILTYGKRPTTGARDSILLVNDTAEFVMLRRDTMALMLNGKVRGFKLKPDTIQ